MLLCFNLLSSSVFSYFYLLFLDSILNLFGSGFMSPEQTDGAAELRVQNVSIIVPDHQIKVQVPSRKRSMNITAHHCKHLHCSVALTYEKMFLKSNFSDQLFVFFYLGADQASRPTFHHLTSASLWTKVYTWFPVSSQLHHSRFQTIFLFPL